MNYLTISKPANASFIEKRSEFIGHIAPVETNEQAVDFINSVKAENRKARHNVYAYILRNENISRYSDDGEPQGTGGVPVLDVLKKRQLTDVCVVVTRYFGGILLGGGGLVRAYSHAASIACDAADIMDMRLCRRIRLTMDYTLYGRIAYLLPNYDVITADSDFGTSVALELLIMCEKYDAFIHGITEAANGAVQIEQLDEMYRDFSELHR